MIVTRSPLRISLGGGGTDLSSYYSKKNGFLVAAAIDKYVYVNITKPFAKGIFLKYSKLEKVNSINKIKHKIFKEVLKDIAPKCDQIEITTLADVPSGTGLGSSSSFTNALVKALSIYNNVSIDNLSLAEKSCKIEIENLNQPIGKQDQFISSYGGITSFEFNKDESVNVSPLKLKPKTLEKLNNNLLIFFTNISRNANDILKTQNQKSKKNNLDMLKNLDNVKKLGRLTKDILNNGNLYDYGLLLNEHWKIKKKRSKEMSNPKINYLYDIAKNNGAIGGKLIGAGGGGFLMFYTEDPNKLREIMKKNNIQELSFNFDFEGTKAIQY